MLLADICHKEIIDLSKGARYGCLGDAKLLFDEKSGEIISLVIESKYRDETSLPWNSIVKIGEDIIIFRSGPDYLKFLDKEYKQV